MSSARGRCRELNGIKCLSMEVIDRDNKSIAHTRTFGRTISTIDEVRERNFLFHYPRARENALEQPNDKDRHRVSKTDRFNPVPYYYTNAATYKSVYHSDVTSEIYTWITACIEKIYRPGMQYKRAGIELSDLKTEKVISLRLFDQRDFERKHKLNKVIDELNFRYGRDILRFAALEARGDWQGKSQHRGNDSYHAVGQGYAWDWARYSANRCGFISVSSPRVSKGAKVDYSDRCALPHGRATDTPRLAPRFSDNHFFRPKIVNPIPPSINAPAIISLSLAVSAKNKIPITAVSTGTDS